MKKILLIENDWTFQASMLVFLCENGFEVESADTGRAGIKKALCTRPDLILMDYDLGDMDGKEAAFWLDHMKGTRTIPVFLLSGGDLHAETVSKIKEYAVCRGILPKTMPLPEILSRIKAAIPLRSVGRKPL